MGEGIKNPFPSSLRDVLGPHMRAAIPGQYGRMDGPRHPVDLYETEPKAVDMLLDHIRVQGPVLEPSAGRGAIVRALRAHGFKVCGSDLYNHDADAALGIGTGVDFLSMKTIADCRSIMMNPPFKESDLHVRHALGLLPRDGVLAVLLRMNWIAAKRCADLLAHLDTMLICGRLRMPPAGGIDKGFGGTVDFAWMVFRRTPAMATRIIRA